MQKQAPSVAKIAIAIGFTLSCFLLLLFLWVTFGGPTPFKGEGYRFRAFFPEAVTLAKQSDVRIGGVTVGKVQSLSLPPKGNATEVEIELDPEYAPLRSDARAILRQKTLLGETFIELTMGSDSAPPVPDGGLLAQSRTAESTQIDEIFDGFDQETRTSFQRWMQNASLAIDGRDMDLSNSLANLGPFTTDATATLELLRSQDQQLSGLIRDTGEVFRAFSAGDQELAGAIVNSNRTFEALASRDQALQEIIQIFPTFNNETRLTLNRLAEFAVDTQPLVNNLEPVADDFSPTFRAVQRLSPNLRRLFVNLDPLLTASMRGLPALRKTLNGLRPLFRAMDPFVANLNPVIRYLAAHRGTVTDFLNNPPHALAGTVAQTGVPGSTGHLLRQISYLSTESLTIQPTRLDTNRGNGYLQPYAITSAPDRGIFPNFDCNGTGEGEIPASQATVEEAPCFVAPDYPTRFGGGQAPNLFADP
jgi:virulence factor Mce-like protein